MASIFGFKLDGSRARGDALSIALVALALLVGGAGTGYPLLQCALEVLAIVLIGRALLSNPSVARGRAFWAILGVFLAAIGLLALQIVSLPPSVWHALPERATAVGIYATLGWSARWHAASLTPDFTLQDMLALLPALAAFVTVAALSTRRRLTLVRVVIGIALLGTMVGALQVAAGQSAPVLYETLHRGFGVGFFVNRNHQATFLLVAMVLSALPGAVTLGMKQGARRLPDRRIVVLGLVAFIAFGVLATGSRTGLALLLPTLLVASAIVFETRRGWAWLVGAVLVYGVVALFLSSTPLVQQTLARVAVASEDLRHQYWDNTRFAIGQTWPWGTGFGSFDTVYRGVEPLTQVTVQRVAHAHNDYLEVALEGGVAGIALMVAGLAVVVLAFVGAWRKAATRDERSAVIAAAAGTALILIGSVLDFPLRMAAIGMLLGLLLGLAIPAPGRGARALATGRTPVVRVVVWVAGAVALCLSLSFGLSDFLVQRGAPGLATTLAPWSARAWSGLAVAEQVDNRSAESGAAALRALAIAPLDAPAVRALGYADVAQHRAARGAALFESAAALGWRDPATQLWLVRRALEIGNLDVAVERIDAVLRRGLMGEPLQRQLRAIFLYPGGSGAIAARLVERPSWRQGFLNAVAEDSPGAVPQTLQLLRALRVGAAAVDPRETGLIRWRLGDAGDYAAVRQIWVESGGRGVIGDGDFAMSSGILPPGAPPYAWQAPGSAGVHVSVTDPEAGEARSLLIASDGFATGPVLAQTIALPAGSYRLSVVLHGDAPSIARASGWSLSCLPPGAASPPVQVSLVATDATGAGAEAARSASARFDVPQGCAGQTLTLALRESAGQPFSLRLDQVRVERLAWGQ